MRDLFHNVNPKVALAPVAAAITDNTAQVCAIIDRNGYQSLTYVIETGTLADADATFAVTIEHGDASNLSDAAAVPANMLLGTLAGASFDFSKDSKCLKLGYIGDKRYTRLTITPSANTGAAPMSVIALLGNPLEAPTADTPN